MKQWIWIQLIADKIRFALIVLHMTDKTFLLLCWLCWKTFKIQLTCSHIHSSYLLIAYMFFTSTHLEWYNTLHIYTNQVKITCNGRLNSIQNLTESAKYQNKLGRTTFFVYRLSSVNTESFVNRPNSVNTESFVNRPNLVNTASVDTRLILSS